MTNKVIIRKPTDEEQREAKIVTSDYAISAVTIHSSVLYHLGLLDKVYRSKETTISPSNKKAIKHLISKLNSHIRYFPNSFTINNAKEFTQFCNDNKEFVEVVKNSNAKTWKSIVNSSSLLKHFSTSSEFNKAQKFSRSLIDTLTCDLMDGMSEDYIEGSDTISDFITKSIKYLNSIAHDAIKKHTQTHIWENAYKNQLKMEELLGEGFTPKALATVIPNNKLDEIQSLWKINLLEFEGSWSELCDYLYSPTIIADIRKSLGVNVRARCSSDIRKGVESLDKQRYENAIKRYEERLGCRAEDFSPKQEQIKIENLKDELAILEVKYSEGLLAKSHSKFSNNDEISKLDNACKSMKNRINYLKKTINSLETSLPKKIEAWNTIIEYEKKNNDLMKFISETRPWEEVATIEQNSLISALNRQRNEQNIPYYTWRFVCDKIDEKTASMIENALEENLNKGCGVNGEDGYINVTSFPMTSSREFFVDYPKSSNMFKAFKKKGK